MPSYGTKVAEDQIAAIKSGLLLAVYTFAATCTGGLDEGNEWLGHRPSGVFSGILLFDDGLVACGLSGFRDPAGFC